MASYVKYENFVEDFLEGVHDFDLHTFKIALTNSAPNVSTHTVLANISELGAGNGYSAGGGATTISTSETGGVAKAVGTDVTFTASGGSIGPFRYAVFYNDTPTSPADPLISYWDYGTNITITNGNSFTVDFNASNGIFTIT
jgi:hypothetical protein